VVGLNFFYHPASCSDYQHKQNWSLDVLSCIVTCTISVQSFPSSRDSVAKLLYHYFMHLSGACHLPLSTSAILALHSAWTDVSSPGAPASQPHPDLSSLKFAAPALNHPHYGLAISGPPLLCLFTLLPQGSAGPNSIGAMLFLGSRLPASCLPSILPSRRS
jgi:hypothetical protein